MKNAIYVMAQLARAGAGIYFFGHGLWTHSYLELVLGCLAFDSLAVTQRHHEKDSNG